jgi:hypothetical protein
MVPEILAVMRNLKNVLQLATWIMCSMTIWKVCGNRNISNSGIKITIDRSCRLILRPRIQAQGVTQTEREKHRICSGIRKARVWGVAHLYICLDRGSVLVISGMVWCFAMPALWRVVFWILSLCLDFYWSDVWAHGSLQCDVVVWFRERWWKRSLFGARGNLGTADFYVPSGWWCLSERLSDNLNLNESGFTECNRFHLYSARVACLILGVFLECFSKLGSTSCFVWSFTVINKRNLLVKFVQYGFSEIG